MTQPEDFYQGKLEEQGKGIKKPPEGGLKLVAGARSVTNRTNEDIGSQSGIESQIFIVPLTNIKEEAVAQKKFRTKVSKQSSAKRTNLPEKIKAAQAAFQIAEAAYLNAQIEADRLFAENEAQQQTISIPSPLEQEMLDALKDTQDEKVKQVIEQSLALLKEQNAKQALKANAANAKILDAALSKTKRMKLIAEKAKDKADLLTAMSAASPEPSESLREAI